MVKLTIVIDDSLHKKLKVKAAQDGVTMKDLIVRCVEKMV